MASEEFLLEQIRRLLETGESPKTLKLYQEMLQEKRMGKAPSVAPSRPAISNEASLFATEPAVPKKSKQLPLFGGKKMDRAMKRVPGVGAIPMPSDVMRAYKDMQSPLLSDRDRMLRFLVGSTNEVASPEEEWAARGGI